MALILCIETATPVCSVALSSDRHLLALRETGVPDSHSSQLALFIRDVIREAGVSFSSLDAIAVSMGPGSYTGLRIGLSTAKGICYGRSIPLIGIPTLQGIAAGILRKAEEETLHSLSSTPLLICPMIDARRMEVYLALYNNLLTETLPAKPHVLGPDSFETILPAYRILFGGPGARKAASLLEHHHHAQFIPDTPASAIHLIPLAYEQMERGLTENLAYCEPFYLKEFIAGKPRVKGLGET